jgi:hypothetical protein
MKLFCVQTWPSEECWAKICAEIGQQIFFFFLSGLLSTTCIRRQPRLIHCKRVYRFRVPQLLLNHLVDSLRGRAAGERHDTAGLVEDVLEGASRVIRVVEDALLDELVAGAVVARRRGS